MDREGEYERSRVGEKELYNRENRGYPLTNIAIAEANVLQTLSAVCSLRGFLRSWFPSTRYSKLEILFVVSTSVSALVGK